jgi:hypothetical protein
MADKMYVGEHFGRDGVFVERGGSRKLLEPRAEVSKWEHGFAWGRADETFNPAIALMPLSLRPIHPGALQLAHAILADYYNNLEIARKAYMRWAYRVLADRDGKAPLVVTTEDIALAYTAILAVEQDQATRLMRQSVDRERPTPVSEFGADVVWDAYQEPSVNEPGDK